jgi:hypothetical protein
MVDNSLMIAVEAGWLCSWAIWGYKGQSGRNDVAAVSVCHSAMLHTTSTLRKAISKQLALFL